MAGWSVGRSEPVEEGGVLDAAGDEGTGVTSIIKDLYGDWVGCVVCNLITYLCEVKMRKNVLHAT